MENALIQTITEDVSKPVRLRLVDAELYSAVKERNFGNIEKCLFQGANVNCHRQDKVTPLHYAVERGDNELVSLLLKQQHIGVNLPTVMGHTALYMAVQLGHSSVVLNLLQHDANTRVCDSHGRTPLHIAVFQNHRDIIDVLVRSGAPINIKDEHGESPLDAAALRLASPAVTRYLLNRGGVPGSNLLHKAVRQAVSMSARDVARILVHHGVSVNERDELTGYTPLHCAVLAGDLVMAQMLLKSGADVHATSNSGLSPLKMASLHRNENMAALLRRNVPRIDVVKTRDIIERR